MKAQHVTLVGFIAIVLGATSAMGAETPKGRPCQPDIQKFCKDIKVGGGRIRDCLKSHASELSAGCKQMMDSNQGIFSQQAAGGGARQRRAQGVLEACKTDLEKHCKGVQPGGGRLRVCLEKHQSELTDACKKTVSALPPESKPGAVGTPAAAAKESAKAATAAPAKKK